MSWKQLAGKGTWLGTATAAVVLLAALGVSSLLLLRGIVPERAMGPLVWGSSVLACFFGGRMAIRQGGDGPLPRALAVSACVYGAVDRGADGKRGDTFYRQRHCPDLRRVGRRPFGGTDRNEAETAEAPQRPPEGR